MAFAVLDSPCHELWEWVEHQDDAELHAAVCALPRGHAPVPDRPGAVLRFWRGGFVSDGGNRMRCGGKGRLHRIAYHREERAAVPLNGGSQERQMACDSRRHRDLVPLPERGTALDVGEEEGDGAGGKIGHEPLQTLGWTWCCPIVA